MRRHTLSIVVLTIVIGISSGVSAETTQPAGEESVVATPPTTTAPATVMAEIRGRQLTWGDIQAFQKLRFPSLSWEKIAEFWKFSVILTDDFEKSGMMDDPEIQAVLKIEDARRLGQLYAFFYVRQIEVTDEDIQAYYDKTAASNRSYLLPAVVSFKVIADKDKGKVDAIKEQIIAGEDFDALREEHAEKTKLVTGLSDTAIEDIRADTLKDAFGIQWRALEVIGIDQTIGPRKISNGYALFKVTKRMPGELKPLDDIRDEIKQTLERTKRKNAEMELYERVRKEAGIEAPLPGSRRAPRRVPSTQPKGK